MQHCDRFIRSGLGLVLSREPDIEVVGEAASAAELVLLCAATRPDVVLLELDADAWDAPRLVAALRNRQRILRCVGMHDSLPPESARRAYQAGVRATVAYSAGTDGIISALRGRSQPVPVPSFLPSRARHAEPLTVREVEVLRLIASGLLAREIGHRIGVTVKTVENHKQRAFRKLGVQNQAHAVSIAIRRGVLSSAAIARQA